MLSRSHLARLLAVLADELPERSRVGSRPHRAASQAGIALFLDVRATPESERKETKAGWFENTKRRIRAAVNRSPGDVLSAAFETPGHARTKGLEQPGAVRYGIFRARNTRRFTEGEMALVKSSCLVVLVVSDVQFVKSSEYSIA